jgi:hypothetical protein
MLYELTTLSYPLLDLDAGSECARSWMSSSDAQGDLLGCWRTDIGTLGRLLVLRGFDTHESLTAERERTLQASRPFGATPGLVDVCQNTYRLFPFLPPVLPARRGTVYEFRTYRLKPGGLKPTLAGWERAIEPAQAYTAHLVVNMYGLDGAPRITHIWAFESLEQRAMLRSNAYRTGVWPPQGGPEQIVEATSTIGIPERYSPLS